MSCKYCEGIGFTDPINDTVEYSGMEVRLFPSQSQMRIRCLDENMDMVSQDIINIKFCPMCGKRLKAITKCEAYYHENNRTECWATKERLPCYCNGNKEDCDYYHD